jgi:hypothetical protein
MLLAPTMLDYILAATVWAKNGFQNHMQIEEKYLPDSPSFPHV